MTKLVAQLLLGAICVVQLGASWADIPEKFVGEWTTEVEQTGYAAWGNIKYPAKLSITVEGVKYVDNWGIECGPLAFHDKELDALIFTHHLPTKSEWAVKPFYRVMVRGDKLIGEVWQHKLRFRWIGVRTKLDREAKGIDSVPAVSNGTQN